MRLLEDLKVINPKDPGGWPWLVKKSALAAIFVAVLLVGAVFDSKKQLDEWNKVKQEEESLKETFLVQKRKAVNLDIIKKQLAETQQSFDALLKQLPSKLEMDALLTDINQAGLGRGLLFDLFRPDAETITGAGVFAEQPITIKVTGNYDDLGKFASDIAQLPRIVSLSEISINSVTGGLLTMDALAKTYRYLDEAELAEQKKLAEQNKLAGAKK